MFMYAYISIYISIHLHMLTVVSGVSSGMIRLVCPHLVKAVDELEKQDIGGINYFDKKLEDEQEGLKLRENFAETNLAWLQIRSKAVTPEDTEIMKQTLGENGADNALNSGIIGCTIGKIQVKCLHAVRIYFCFYCYCSYNAVLFVFV